MIHDLFWKFVWPLFVGCEGEVFTVGPYRCVRHVPGLFGGHEGKIELYRCGVLVETHDERSVNVEHLRQTCQYMVNRGCM